jgi:NAD(P)-dependent dehydrogenase (short-subunit alcohol dehydrogenase family)
MDTILITGGNGEMSKRLIKHFYRKYTFVALDVHETISSDISGFGVDYFKCDITNTETLLELKHKILLNYKSIVGFINNAAIDFVPSVNSKNLSYSSEIALNVLNVNVVGAMNVIEVFKDEIKKNKINIINISSIYSKVPPDQSIYSDIILDTGERFCKPIYYGLSKAALNYVSKFYVNELSKHGVRVNTLVFGGIDNNQPDSFKNKYTSKVPLGRMGNWEDVLNAFEFLLSNDSNYITGLELVVDGGFLNAS